MVSAKQRILISHAEAIRLEETIARQAETIARQAEIIARQAETIARLENELESMISLIGGAPLS